MTEREYRALPIDSYSSLKVFLDDRKKYYNKFILDQEVKEEESEYLTQGSLVDCLFFTPELYASKFALSTSQIPTGQYYKFVQELMRFTRYATNVDTREVGRGIEEMMLDAYNAVKFDRDGNVVDFKRDSFDVVKRKFIGTELQAYYEQLRSSEGKDVIDLSMKEKADATITMLKTNFVTRDIVNQTSDERYRVHYQFPIIGQLGMSLTGGVPYPLKCLLDMLVIDREQRRIYIYDLKTCWDNEQEFLRNYLKYRYYIQMGVYFYLVTEWKNSQEDLRLYHVEYPRFIVAESSNYKNPLIYSTTEENFRQGMRGFVINNRPFAGVIKAVQDLMWHKENAIWNISRDNFNSNGVVALPAFQ